MKRANKARSVVFMQSVVLSSQAIKYGVDPAHFMQQRWQDHSGQRNMFSWDTMYIPAHCIVSRI